MIKTIIFDFDGVLIDTEKKGVIDNYNLLKINGIECPNLEELKELVGTTDIKNYEYIYMVLSIDINKAKLTLEKYIEKNPYTIELFFEGTNGILECLNKKYSLIIASNSPMEFIRKMINEYGIEDYFYKIYSCRDMVAPKPSPEIYNYIVSSCGLNKDECIVVEDSLIGVEAALKADIKVIGKEDDFLNISLSKANYLIKDLKELPDLLRRIDI